MCGVSHLTLNDPVKNPSQSIQMENHHDIIEWALANVMDANHFNNALHPNLEHRHPYNPIYKREMTNQEMKDRVDHSQDNLWVLCDVHHRHKFLGIHEISYPIWCPQDLLSPEFQDDLKKQVKGDGNDNQ